VSSVKKLLLQATNLKPTELVIFKQLTFQVSVKTEASSPATNCKKIGRNQYGQLG
jgi:hypothetical protein